MGKKNRERVARILAGEETPLSGKVRTGAVNAGVIALKGYSTSKQVQFLADALHTGRLSPSKLQQELKANAPIEMKKGAGKLVGNRKAVTVDALLEEYNKDIGFQKLASEVGLDRAYFTELAEAEVAKW